MNTFLKLLFYSFVLIRQNSKLLVANLNLPIAIGIFILTLEHFYISQSKNLLFFNNLIAVFLLFLSVIITTRSYQIYVSGKLKYTNLKLWGIIESKFFLLIIAIGLGCGANQLIITTVGIIFALLLIVIYSSYMKSSRKNVEETINLGIIIDQDISDIQINNLISEIKKVSSELKFISMSRTEANTTINFDVKPKKFEKLSMLSGQIKKKFKNSKVILAYNDDLSL